MTLFLGSHRHPVKMIIDTGSSWTWVQGKKCPKHQCKGNKYYKKKSDTTNRMKKKVKIRYGKGMVKGKLYKD